MIFLKADTNTEVLIGPAVAVGDGFTPVTTLSLSTADEAELIKYGGATPLTVTSISASAMTAITGADGYYTLDLSTSNTDTEGFLVVVINDDSLILPIRQEFMVVNANVYDSLFAAAATDVLDVNVTQWLGIAAATPTVAGVPEVDLTHVAGATTNVSALATNVDAILTDTSTSIPALLPPALVGGRMDSNVSAIANDATAATNLSASALSIVPGACEGTPSTTVIQTDLAEATDDHYIGRVVIFTSGDAAYQATDITDYTGSTGTITVTALTTAPAASDTFVVI